MRLLIISNMSHYRDSSGIVGWGPTVEEISHIAGLFDDVVHIACLHPEAPPKSSLPYAAAKVRLAPVPPAGGRRLKDKIEILFRLPRYLWVILRELPRADAVHVRAPANISLLAMVLLAFMRQPRKRWIKYAGSWRPEGREPWSYRFQRWWLRRNFARAHVTVNGRWPGDPPYVHSFPNPCMTGEEYARAGTIAGSKKLEGPLTLIHAGALTPKKGAGIAVDTLAHLRDKNLEARLIVAGDGPSREAITARVRKLGLEDRVELLGFVPHPRLGEQYARAHFTLLPSSSSEGWPKVLGEGMAYGAVPIASAVSSIPQVLHEARCGLALNSLQPEAYAQAIRQYLDDPGGWRREAAAGHAYAERFTYEAHVRRVADLFGLADRNGEDSP